MQDLTQYGNIKYFFSHDNYIRLIWSCLVIEQMLRQSEDEGAYDRMRLKPQFWIDAKEAIESINPNTIQFSSIQPWVQCLQMFY